MKRLRDAWSVIAVLGVLMVGGAAGMSAAVPSHRPQGPLGWLGIGPRVVDDGHIGGDSCNCDGEGNTAPCPAKPMQTCNDQYFGCTQTGSTKTKLCIDRGNPNYCGRNGCAVATAQGCSGTSCTQVSNPGLTDPIANEP